MGVGVVDEFKNGSPFALNSTQFEFGGYGTDTSLDLCRGNTQVQGLGWLSWLERRSHIHI